MGNVKAGSQIALSVQCVGLLWHFAVESKMPAARKGNEFRDMYLYLNYSQKGTGVFCLMIDSQLLRL
jgi:hypothetical protein